MIGNLSPCNMKMKLYRTMMNVFCNRKFQKEKLKQTNKKIEKEVTYGLSSIDFFFQKGNFTKFENILFYSTDFFLNLLLIQ